MTLTISLAKDVEGYIYYQPLYFYHHVKASSNLYWAAQSFAIFVYMFHNTLFTSELPSCGACGHEQKFS